MIKERYAKVFVEESIRQINESNAAFGIYLSNSEIKQYFIQPFVNVLKVAKIALKDVGSGVLYNMRILFTFNQAKQARLAEAYKQSREKYRKEYEPIMKNIDESLGTDAKLIMFMANPVGVMTFYAAKQGISAAKFVGDVFDEQRKAEKGIGPDGPTATPDGPILGALGDLKKLFFGEAYIVGKLLEAEGESPDIESDIRKAMESAGVDPEKIKQDFMGFVKVKEDAINQIDEEKIPDRVMALRAMMNAKNYDELEVSITKAKSVDIDLGNYLKDFNAELQRGIEEIALAFNEEVKNTVGDSEKKKDDPKKKKDPPMIASLKKLPKIKKLGDKATKEDYIGAMKESLFNTLKENLQEDGNKIMTEIQDNMREVIGILLAPYEDVSGLAELKEIGGEANKIAEKIENTVKKITG